MKTWLVFGTFMNKTTYVVAFVREGRALRLPKSESVLHRPIGPASEEETLLATSFLLQGMILLVLAN